MTGFERSEHDYDPVLRAQTSLHVYCYFDGISMSIPYGTVENYRLASTLASRLTGPAHRPLADEDERFYLKTREQLDALFCLAAEAQSAAGGLKQCAVCSGDFSRGWNPGCRCAHPGYGRGAIRLRCCALQRSAPAARGAQDPVAVERERGDAGEAATAVAVAGAGRPTHHADDDGAAGLHLEGGRAGIAGAGP